MANNSSIESSEDMSTVDVNTDGINGNGSDANGADIPEIELIIKVFIFDFMKALKPFLMKLLL